MNTQHTPGPWTVAGRDVVGKLGEMDTCIAECFNHSSMDRHNAEANARLIAAAPELLEAVKISLEFLDRQNTPKNIQEQISFKNHQREILTKVIAKAEGK